jgi:phosphoadenosine phosphosulfate reductase
MRGLATAPAPPELEGHDAHGVLIHVLERYHPRLALACSFQKEEAVLIDMLLKLEPAARVFTIDTGALFPETYQAWRDLENHYGIRVEVFDAQDSAGLQWTASRCCSASPLADWSEQAVWDYIARHNVPYNSLHDRGYASIGCSPCTLPGSGREGRWAGSDKVECGLHLDA